jgi:hypothetical protein
MCDYSLITKDDRPADGSQVRYRQYFGDNFRADPDRVAHGDADNRGLVVTVHCLSAGFQVVLQVCSVTLTGSGFIYVVFIKEFLSSYFPLPVFQFAIKA